MTPSVELETLRESQDRALHLEGIPMFVALVDERPDGSGGKGDGPAPDSGPHRLLVSRLQHYRDVLGPTRRDGDMGLVISVLTVTAYEDFDRSVT